MKKLNLILTLFLVGTLLMAQNNSKYSRAKVHYNTPENLQLLSQYGIPMEHGKHKVGWFVENDFSAEEIQTIRSLGIQVDILIDDVQKFYVDRNKTSSTSTTNKNASCSSSGSTSYNTPVNFNHGSMGGFLTYTEMLAELDSMVLLYPNLITAKAPVDTFLTHQNRPLYWVRISDNPNTDEAEPEMLYDAVHHAREPASMQQLVFYMWYLLENYATNPEVQAVINNTELYFIPIVNPDGYVYNETTNPNGGGMHRKNMRDNGSGIYGVDNNRNYDHLDENSNSIWGTTGVSFTTSADTYCGPAPFSEPENNAMKWFCEQHTFKMAINNHTYSDLLLFPFGYDLNKPTPDSATFEAITGLMVSQNTMTNEIAATLYPASGDSDDWMYGDTLTHHKIFSMTPELGSSSQGFWPVEADIDGICKSMIYLNLTAAHLITNYAQTTDLMPLVINNTNGFFNYNIQRLGMEEPANFTVSIIPISSNIISVGTPKSHNNMAFLQTDVDSISYTLNPSIVDGDLITYVLAINNGTFMQYDTLTKIYGQQLTVFSDQANNLTNWLVSSTWNTTTSTFYSPSSSITDSPSGNYQNNTNRTITLANGVNLINAVSATLSYYAKWDIEDNWDYVQVEVSTNNGSTWTPQCGKYTQPGNADQALNEPLYDGTQWSWVKEEIDLSNYIGQNIKVRFQIVSDGGVVADGFYFDDFNISVIYGSTSVNELTENGPFLGQSFPNPTNDVATINYILPKGINTANLVVINALGQTVSKTIISANTTRTSISTTKWNEGVYFYFIENNHQRSPTKKMTVVR